MYLENILEVVKSELLIDLKKNKSRKREVVDARRIYSDIARQLNIFSFTEIGKKINKDHASVIHYIKTSNDFKRIDREYQRKYDLVFSKTIKVNTDEKIISNYLYYKEKYEKYNRLLKELNEKDQDLQKKSA